MDNKYEEFKKWFLQNRFKIKRDVHWIDPGAVFRSFELEYYENRTVRSLEKICKKYNIPFNDLPGVLEEYIATDNEEYMEKLRSQRE